MTFIWTDHALDRIKQRKITQDFAQQTLDNPDEIINQGDSFKYNKKIDNQTATAIVKKNDLGENIVVSFWVYPPNPGTNDYKNFKRRREFFKAGPFRKTILTLLNQLGL